MEFNYYAIPPMVASIISFITGFYILRKNPKSELHIVWFGFLFVIALWTLGEAGIRLVGTDDLSSSLLWHNLLVVPGGGFIGVFFLHFSLIFPNRHPLRDKRYLLPLIYFIMIGFYIHALIRGWVIDESVLNEVANSYTRESLTRAVAKEVYEINMIYIAILSSAGIFIFVQKFFALKGSPQQSQIGIIIFATAFFLGAGLFTDVLFPIVGINTVELASVGALATALLVAAVLWKYKLDEIALISEDIKLGKLEDWLTKYKLYKGYTYLIPEQRVDLSFKLFAREISKGAHGLVVTTTPPSKVRAKYKLFKTPIIWIALDPSQRNSEVDDPNVIITGMDEVLRIKDLIEQFLVKSINNIIYLEDLNKIYSVKTPRNKRQILLSSAKTTFELVNQYNSRFIISLHPNSLNASKSRRIIRTKSPLLDMRLLTIFILEDVYQQILEAVEVRAGREAIDKKLHWLKSADPFFTKLKFENGKVVYTAVTMVFREDLIRKIKMFITTFRSLDRTLDLDPIALRILMKYGFSKYEYDLQTGNTYMVKDPSARISFDIFQQFVDTGYEGLCITKTNPKKIFERYGLRFDSDNIFWLTDIATKSEHVIPPKLENIFMEIENYIERTPENKIIILDGVEYLISYSGDIFDTVLAFLRRLSDKISESDAFILIPLNFDALNQQRLSLLSRSGLVLYKP
jgi:hypothetical protein